MSRPSFALTTTHESPMVLQASGNLLRLETLRPNLFRWLPSVAT